MRRVLDLAKLTLMTSRVAKLQPTRLVAGQRAQQRELGLSSFLGFSRGLCVPSGINRASSEREGSSSNKGNKMPPTKGGSGNKIGKSSDICSKSKSRGKGKGTGKGKTNKQEHRNQKQQPLSSFFSSKSNSRKTTISNIKKIETGTAATNSVKHDKVKNRFTMDLGNKQEARINYKSIGQNLVEMYHSEVPRELRGRGIGKALAKGALEQALKNNMKVKLTCSYLINYLEKFPDPKFKGIVDNNKHGDK